MVRRPLAWALAGVLLAAAPAAAQLRPEHVLVVANADAKGSEALGREYCRARGILPEMLLVLHTTAGADISREEYDTSIRDPIREYLKRKKLVGRVRCIVLVWGVPVRVLGTKMTDPQKELVAAYRTRQRRLAARLAVNLDLLGRVCLTFPKPRTVGLTPVSKLFEANVPANPDKLARFGDLVDDFADRLKRNSRRAGKLTDPQQRNIALRQLAGLRLDTYGAQALLKDLVGGKVSPPPGADQLGRQIESDVSALARLRSAKQTPQIAREAAEVALRLRGVVGAHEYCQSRIDAVGTDQEDASVDSELALLWDRGGKLRKWRPNPMNWRLAASATKPANTPENIVMTARIDGPTAADALRIVKDSVAAEKTRLKGTFYIDAGGKHPHYDKHLRRLADLAKKLTDIPVKYDDRKAVFGPGQCPDAMLYVGWYSLRNYVPAFSFVRGAVGWHIASLEAQHLRAPANKEWCVKLIQNGIAGTLGAVNEPFLGAFPPPDEFFALLLTGRFTIGECYWRTVPLVSWRMTLIADPLYNPFQLHPHLSIYDLPPQLGGWKAITPATPASAPHIDTRPAS